MKKNNNEVTTVAILAAYNLENSIADIVLRTKNFVNHVIIDMSKNYNPDIIILKDADGQHLTEEMSTLIVPISSENYEME